VRLVSRRNHVYKAFPPLCAAEELKAIRATLWTIKVQGARTPESALKDPAARRGALLLPGGSTDSQRLATARRGSCPPKPGGLHPSTWAAALTREAIGIERCDRRPGRGGVRGARLETQRCRLTP
jgi:hypothetical protein